MRFLACRLHGGQLFHRTEAATATYATASMASVSKEKGRKDGGQDTVSTMMTKRVHITKIVFESYDSGMDKQLSKGAFFCSADLIYILLLEQAALKQKRIKRAKKSPIKDPEKVPIKGKKGSKIASKKGQIKAKKRLKKG